MLNTALYTENDSYNAPMAALGCERIEITARWALHGTQPLSHEAWPSDNP